MGPPTPRSSFMLLEENPTTVFSCAQSKSMISNEMSGAPCAAVSSTLVNSLPRCLSKIGTFTCSEVIRIRSASRYSTWKTKTSGRLARFLTLSCLLPTNHGSKSFCCRWMSKRFIYWVGTRSQMCIVNRRRLKTVHPARYRTTKKSAVRKSNQILKRSLRSSQKTWKNTKK